MRTLKWTSDLSISKINLVLITLAKIFVFAGLTALASKVQFFLPFSPVPITLQSFAVLLSGVLLGSKKGALSQISLIGMGLCGLPVFSVATAGPAVLFGPTGGYIFGFMVAAFVAGWFFESFKPKSLSFQCLFLLLASFCIFIPGIAWLQIFTGKSLWLSLKIGFYPFLPGDVLKCLAAAFFIRALRAVSKKNKVDL